MIGHEHDPEGRDDPVEGAVGERQLHRVALDPLDLDACLGGVTAGEIEQLGVMSRPVDLRPLLRRRNRDVRTVAGADVEERQSRLDPDVSERTGPDRRDHAGEALPASRGPGRSRASPILVGSHCRRP